MTRVQRIFLMQTFLTPLVLSVVLLLATVWGIGREVWVAHVFHNMPSLSPAHVASIARFFEAAFFNTRFAVQVLVLAVLAAVVWLGYLLSKAIRYTLKFT